MKSLRVLLAFVLAVALVPAAAFSALASEGEFFEVDGLYYLYTGATAGVQLVGADPEVVGAEDGICTVPASVEYEGKTLVVMSIKHNQTIYNPAPNASAGGGFVNCTLLRDLRIECLSASADTLYCSAGISLFEGCTNLEVVHFMGNGGTADTGAAALANLKVVVHAGCVDAENGAMSSMGNYTASGSPSLYFSVVFEQEDGSLTEVFVSENATVAQLSDLSESLVYTDSAWYGEDGLALESAAPELDETGAWVFVTEAGSQLSAESSISDCGTATETSILNLDNASLHVATSDIAYSEQAGCDPGAYVVHAGGAVLDASCYELTCYTSAGVEIALADVVDCDTYTLVASGVGDYTGSCECTFTVSFVESSWTRANGGSVVNILNLRHLLSYQARAYQSAFTNAAGESISTSVVLVVNGDDYASCVVAASLSGVFNCSVITVDEDCIRASNGKLTATNVTNYASVLANHVAIVLGSSEYISDAVYNAVCETVGDGGGATRFNTEGCTTSAEVAEAVWGIMEQVYEGDLDLGVVCEEFATTAMVVPEAGGASVFSALTYANTNNIPVFFAAADKTLSTKTASILAGFEAVEYVGFAEGDEFELAVEYAEAAMAAGTNTCSSLAVCSPEDYGRLSAVAAQAGFAGAVMVLCDDTSAAAQTLFSFVRSHKYEVDSGYVFATYAEIPLATQISAHAIRMQESATAMEFATVKAITTYAYTGKAITPVVSLTACDGSALVEGTDYLLYYYKSATGEQCYDTTTESYQVSMTTQEVIVSTTSKMVEPGEYTVVAKGTYEELKRDTELMGTVGTCSGMIAFTITIEGTAQSGSGGSGEATALAKQSITVKAAKATLKAKKLKKKALTCTFKVTGAKGALVATAANAKSKKALKVKTSGKKSVIITVKKGAKKGTYKVKVYAKATSSHKKSAVKTITIKVK